MELYHDIEPSWKTLKEQIKETERLKEKDVKTETT
jgi:hypothetical protein